LIVFIIGAGSVRAAAPQLKIIRAYSSGKDYPARAAGAASAYRICQEPIQYIDDQTRVRSSGGLGVVHMMCLICWVRIELALYLLNDAFH